MRSIKTEFGDTKLWLSANDTYDWAHKAGTSWPCSQLSGKPIFAEFDANGDLTDVSRDCDSTEFNACISDFLRKRYGPDHPAIR